MCGFRRRNSFPIAIGTITSLISMLDQSSRVGLQALQVNYPNLNLGNANSLPLKLFSQGRNISLPGTFDHVTQPKLR